MNKVRSEAMKKRWQDPEFRSLQFSRRGKLTDEDVLGIRKMLTEPAPQGFRKPTYAMIGERFGVSAVMVHKIAVGKSFKQVGEPA